jgi:hypothetical protein
MCAGGRWREEEKLLQRHCNYDTTSRQSVVVQQERRPNKQWIPLDREILDGKPMVKTMSWY